MEKIYLNLQETKGTCTTVPSNTVSFLDGVQQVVSHTHLGLTFQSNMSWNNHILSVYEKASQRLNMLKPLKFKIDKSTLDCLYKSFILPIMEYGDIIWDDCTAGNSELLESVQ